LRLLNKTYFEIQFKMQIAKILEIGLYGASFQNTILNRHQNWILKQGIFFKKWKAMIFERLRYRFGFQI
jgi:hypothetical protein